MEEETRMRARGKAALSNHAAYCIRTVILLLLLKQYGFPGATDAYVLQDGTAGVAATWVADIEAGTPMTVQSRGF